MGAPCLKLTTRPWKSVLGRRSFPFGIWPIFSGVCFLFFRTVKFWDAFLVSIWFNPGTWNIHFKMVVWSSRTTPFGCCLVAQSKQLSRWRCRTWKKPKSLVRSWILGWNCWPTTTYPWPGCCCFFFEGGGEHYWEAGRQKAFGFMKQVWLLVGMYFILWFQDVLIGRGHLDDAHGWFDVLFLVFDILFWYTSYASYSI